MKTRTLSLISLVLMLSLALGACATQPAAPVVESTEPPVVEPTEPPAAEPTAAPEEPVVREIRPEDLDASYDVFLASMKAYNTVGLGALNEMLAESPAPFLLDVRQPEEVTEKGYIAGTVNIPLRELGENLDLLPSFDTPIVSYCGSGWRCTIAMTALEALGWENVLSLKEGSFGGWVEAGYPYESSPLPEAEARNAAQPDDALAAHMAGMFANIPEGWGGIDAEGLNTALAENPDLVVIDVRRQEEVDGKGSIDAPNQLHIPLEQFIEARDQWPADTDTRIVVYCGSGHRSTMAMTMLWSYGYTDVQSLKGGFSGWQEAGYPVVGGAPDLDTAFATFLADMEAYNTMSLETLNEMLIEEPPPFLLDVREASELEANGHIQGTVNIPLREVTSHTELLPSFDTPIVSYCGSGWRCTIAMTALEALGWEDVYSLKGNSFSGWVEAGYPVENGLAPEPVVLDVASPDPALLGVVDDMLSSVPEGFGGITAPDLNSALVEDPELILIDVRRPEEVAEKGVIEASNVLAIPLEDFIAMKDLWPADLDAPIVIYCGSGHRSTIAMTILWTYGYTDVLSLKGGFNAWAEAGFPVAEYAAP